MILDSFRQDVRVGLRVLFKDKIFCFLAMLVLGLGIGGATTQFTSVNAIVLRGFSFPHPEQLMSVGLIDPKATDQNNNFGLGNIPTAQDYEDLKAAQKSFSMMAGYLSGSTINVTYKNNPQRYTGGYVTEDLFKIIGVSPMIGRDFTAADNKPGAEKVTILGDAIWRSECGIHRACAPFGKGQSEDKSKFHVGKRAATAARIYRCAVSPASLGNARCGHSRLADCVRERNEHAVRAGSVACQRVGDSRRA